MEYKSKDSTYSSKNVSLSFKKQYDGKFILTSGSAYGFETDVVKTTSEDSYKSTWTRSDVDSLKKGDSSTGEGGANLKDIIKKHGNPTEASATISNYGEGFKETLDLTYNSSDSDSSKENYVALEFIKAEDSDDYLLSYKYPNDN